MKTFKHLLILCFLVVLVACSEDALVPQSEEIPVIGGESVDFISMTVPDIEMGDATTRSKLYEDGDELKFIWEENDAIGVVPLNGRPLSFPIHSENIQQNTAVFDGGDWALKTSTKYAAFFPYKKNNYEKDITSIAIDYDGQTQGNWMKYDFLATGAIQPKDGAVKFTMKRLSAILKIKVNTPYNNHVRFASLIAPEPLFAIKGTLDLSGNEPVYTPEVMSKSINTDLGQDNVSVGNDFIFYLMIPPTDLSGKTLKFRTNSVSGYVKEVSIAGQNFEAGKAYYINAGRATDAFITNANLIEAAGLSSLVENGKVNAWTNREQIMQVKVLDIRKTNDPTICDEIGFFRNLEELDCSENDITSLDISNNPKLTYLDCYDNQLTSLDVSNNTALTTLSCSYNQLTSLDVSNNTELEYLICYRNQLTSLDLSNNKKLTGLTCDSNQFTSLDLSNNPELDYLCCDNNQLTSLDLSNNPKLNEIYCSNNHQLTSLDVSNIPSLHKLYCYSNQLTSLDLSNNTWLYELHCYSNQLSSLNVSNCTLLKNLRCYNNLLTSLDASISTLQTLYCYSNQLTSLDVSDCCNMTKLHCYKNQLSSIDVSNCTAMTEFRCDNNQLTSLDLSNNTALQYLYCGHNDFISFTLDTGSNGLSQLNTLDISYCSALIELNCIPSDYVSSGNGYLKNLSIYGCTNLGYLNCFRNQLSSLSVLTNTKLVSMSCHNNRIKTLNITKCSLRLNNIICGSQWKDSDKTEAQTLTLTYTSSQYGSGLNTNGYNSNVSLQLQDP